MKNVIYFSDNIHILHLCLALLLNSFFFVIAYKGNNISAADILLIDDCSLPKLLFNSLGFGLSYFLLLFFERSLFCHQGFIYLIQYTVKTAQLWKINAI